MFGLKWLWKTNGGSNIDTSNFVSKDFLNTTLQDYVNRGLLNTTLSNELANYVSTTTLNNTLNNYVSTNTEQTITGVKTFQAAPVVFKLKQVAGRSDKQYITFNTNNNTTTFSLGSSIGETSFEANQGNILFQTQQANKTVKFETANVNFETVTNVLFNRAVPQFGTEIKAGWGGGSVKFLPEDNSTKTLQFFETNNTSQRRFNLLVPEPTQANNPTTKNYVDNLNSSNVEQINDLNIWRNEKNNELNTINNVLQNMNNKVGLQLYYQDLDLSSLQKDIDTDLNSYTRLVFTISTLQNVKLITMSINYTDQDVLSIIKQFVFNYAEGNNSKIYCSLSSIYSPAYPGPTLNKTFVRIFYINPTGTRVQNPYFIVEGGK